MLSVGSLFSGIGLLDYGLHLAGIEHRWLCESDPWRRGILTQRWPGARVLDDVRHVGHGCEPVELIAGGFPCKGASTAGKRNGFEHAETVLWREMRRAVCELRPRYVLVENVANILSLHRGEVWGEVLGDLAALGYDVVWDCIPAAAVGATHLRDRVFAVATYADGEDQRRHAGLRSVPDGRSDARGSDQDAPAAGRNGVRQQPESERGSGGAAVPAVAGATAANDERSGRGPDERDVRTWEPDADRRVGVDWGAYDSAIRRWEAVHGPAPEPLVRRMDDRSSARVERSRLSALGDGVQVQIGRIAGEYIVGLERARQGGLS